METRFTILLVEVGAAIVIQIALLAAVSIVACWLPAWRAARVDPCITLKAE